MPAFVAVGTVIDLVRGLVAGGLALGTGGIFVKVVAVSIELVFGEILLPFDGVFLA